MSQILIYSFVIMLASLIGVISIWKGIGHWIEKRLSLLVSFSAGVFSVITYELAVEALGHDDGIWYGLIWIIVGIVLLWVLFRYLPDFHHHHDSSSEEHTHDPIDARKILLSDGIHNIGDGILLTTSFLVSGTLGIITAISIFVHELVQEISQFFVLRQAGFSIGKSLKWNFIVSATILIGSVGTYLLLDAIEILEVPLLGLAAGSFIVVILQDLIPHSVRSSRVDSSYHKHILAFIIGGLIMVATVLLSPHIHG